MIHHLATIHQRDQPTT